jgi:tRNA(Ser,Leu) C12 N-acetylase TAN1
MSSVEEEERLGSMVFEILEGAGAACEVEFGDPDAVVAVEILDNEAGLSLWTREDLKRYPFLGLD